MTTPACPGCGAALTGTPDCSSCGLPLVGPTAGRLWQVDQRLVVLDGERTTLLAERGQLLTLLRSGAAPRVAVAGFPTEQPLAARQRVETSPQQVQNTLLTLGALLLVLAGLVFAAVTYRHLGVAGRALVLLALTAAAAAAPARLLRRGLGATAEALASVALVLALVDVWAMRQAGVAAGTDARSYAAVALALVTAAAAGYATLVPVRAARVAAVTLAQLSALLLLARLEPPTVAVAVALAALAALDLLVAPRTGTVERVLLRVYGGALLLGSLIGSLVDVGDGRQVAAWGFAAVAVVLAGTAWRATGPAARLALPVPVVPLAAAAAWAAARPVLPEVEVPLVLLAVVAVGLVTAVLLPRERRDGAVLGALGVTAVAVLVHAEAIALAVAGPLTWLADPWSLSADGARAAVSTDPAWQGTPAVPVAVLTAAACCAGGGLLLHRFRSLAVPAGVLGVAGAVLVPVGLDLGFRVALAVLLGIAAVSAGAGTVLLPRRREVGLALVYGGLAVALLAAAWSTAQEGASLVVLPAVAVLCAATAVRLPGPSSALAVLGGGAALAAAGAHAGLAADQVGGLLLTAAAAGVALGQLLRAHRLGCESAAGVLGLAAVGLTLTDPGWLSWVLAGSGVLAVAVAVRPDRREVAVLGGLLLSASSWVRLADAGVQAPEPYVLPLAAVALLLGHLRRRTTPALGSFAAYGAGLSLALVPSLLRSLADEGPARALLLLVASAAVVVVGGATRLRAPIVLGAGVLVVDGLHLLAPYAAALPRWVIPALLGGLLVTLGMTYEQRRAEITRARDRYAALG